MLLTKPNSRQPLRKLDRDQAVLAPLNCRQSCQAAWLKVQRRHAYALWTCQRRCKTCCIKALHSCRSSRVSVLRHW